MCRFIVLLSLFISSNLFAGVALEGTRVVFDASASSQSVNVINTNRYDVVVQSWVDNGELSNLPIDVDSPLITKPALFTLAPGQSQVIQLINIKRKPVTTEQLYWLNLYELPPNTNHQSDKIALIMQTQYKVFYRNASMTLSNEEFEKVIELSEEEEQGKHYLRIRNQSDIHVNLSKIEINGHHYKNFNRTILPRSSEKVLLTSPIKNSPITLILIDDEGLFFSISKEIR